MSWWAQSQAASAHLIILRSGEVWLTVPLESVAWHAGTDGSTGRTAFWRTHNVNGQSIGVECEGFASQPFPSAQIAAIRQVADWLAATYPIPREHTLNKIAGHHAHAEISNQRGDPGPHWDWDWVL